SGVPFPLVILDDTMPEMDGFVVAEKIRNDPELTSATVIMLTSGMPTDAARCDGSAATSCLPKPVSQADLLDTILIAMDRTAMAAHAMAGDCERCLGAGMDDYISKPLQNAQLLALLERISAGRNATAGAASATPADGPRAPESLENLQGKSSIKSLSVFSRKQ